MAEQAILTGGPFDGTLGEIVDKGQKTLVLGPKHERIYIYVRSDKPHEDGITRWLYNHKATVAYGLETKVLKPQDLLPVLPNGDVNAPGTTTKVEATQNHKKNRWELRVDGKIIATKKPLSSLRTHQEIDEWRKEWITGDLVSFREK